MKKPFGVAALLLTCLLSACGEKKPGAEGRSAAAEEPQETAAADGALTLTTAQMQAVGIETGTVASKNLTSVVRASGQLAVPPQNKADVNVLYGGIVRAIHVLEGQAVRKGQTLFLIENTEAIQLQQDYLAAKRGFSYVAQEYQRQQALKAADAGTGKSYQAAEANYRAEAAKLTGMEQRLRQIGINPATVAAGAIAREVPVKAPISGTVGDIAVSTGTFAQPGTPLMEIVDNAKIHADLTVYEKDLFKVRNGQTVRFLLTNQNNQEIEGTIYGVNKSFEGDTKGIIVHAALKANRYGLIPGMYVTALIDVGRQQGPAVPTDAIVRSEGKEYVFRLADARGAARRFQPVEVATGVSELGYTQITPVDSLAPDAVIVTKGAFYVLSKAQGGAEEED